MITKKALVSTFLTLLLISILYVSNTIAQDYRTLNLPKGAKARLGKGWVSGNIEYSPNGHRLAVASSIGIWIYNSYTFAEVALLTGHRGHVISVAFSGDSKKLVSGGDDGTVRLWDVRTGKLLHTITDVGRGVDDVAFSPDGKMFGSIHADEDIRLWDASTYQLLHTLRDDQIWIGSVGRVNCLAFSTDSKVVAGGYYHGRIRLWNANTGEHFGNAGFINYGGINTIAFSSDGITFASGGGDGSVHLLGARTAEHWQRVGSHRRNRLSAFASGGNIGGISSVAFSPDAKMLASGGSDNKIKIWDTSTGEHVRTLDGHTSPVLGVSFSPNRRTIASASWTEIRFWNMNTGRQQRILTGYTNSVYSVSFSPDGKTLATGGFGSNIHLWNANTGAHKQAFTGHTGLVRSVAFSPNGKTLASGGFDETVRLWDVATGENKRTLTGHKEPIQIVSFSQDGKTLASGSQDNYVRLWNVATGEDTYKFYPSGEAVYSVDLSPDGQTLVTATTEEKRAGGVYLLHIRTQRRLKTFSISKYTFSAVFSPDGRTIAVSVGRNIWLWDPRSGERLRNFTGHTDWVLSLAFSSNGKTLASGSKDNTIRLWDVATGDHKQTLTGHRDVVQSVSFSPNGRTLASGSPDGTVLLWQLTPSGPQTPKTNLTVDVNSDGKVNKTDLLRVVSALGKKSTKRIRVDVNGDGVVDVADLLLVIENLDDPKDAAAPANREIVASLNPAMLSLHLDILRAQNDGTLTYALAIGFLESLRVAATPETTALLANYPNPFNPDTWIPYQLSEPAEVTLHIYAVDGRLIRTLALGHQPAGMYHSNSRAAYWDGKNNLGESVASGVYFYTLTAGDFTATRKMLIRK